MAAMDFRTFFYQLPLPDRLAFAQRCNTSVGHLRNIAYGKPCREKLAIAIERESRRKVVVETLCPDVDWGYLRGTEKGCLSTPHEPETPPPQADVAGITLVPAASEIRQEESRLVA